MEKRILLSFALSFGVLLIFYQFLYTPPPVEESVQQIEPPAVESERVEAPGASLLPPVSAEGSSLAIQAETIEVVRIETRDFDVELSNLGATVRSIRLLDYAGAAGERLELLGEEAGAAVGWPLEVVTGDEALDTWLESSLWSVASDGRTVSFELAEGDRRALKRLQFEEDGFTFGFEAAVEAGGQPVPFAVVWQGNFGDQSTDYAPDQVNVLSSDGVSFERLGVGEIEDPQPMPATAFLGLEDRYFLAMLRGSVAESPSVRRLEYTAPGAEDAVPIPRVEFPYSGPLDIYVGPKHQAELEEMDSVLVSVIDYGWFDFIARPMLVVLIWIDGFLGNFGWSIVVMTILLNFALFPLRLKQQLSMLKMQKIQPQMRTLQDKYKKLKPNDPRRQELQTEMMGLYQKHGVNPLGGCLPLLLQMPIFFAIFQLLRTAIELRQAPWMLWVQDLSVPDPYVVLPIVMGVSMLATQKLTPTAMDPTQARMMMLMPVVFVFFMLRAQSGLVLYWLTSNLVGVGQQVLINKFWAPTQKKEPKGTEEPRNAGPEPSESISATDETPSEGESPKRRRRRKR